eukprot:scaffold87113_cov69-Phaeocystis_antarctica.AAC.2
MHRSQLVGFVALAVAGARRYCCTTANYPVVYRSGVLGLTHFGAPGMAMCGRRRKVLRPGIGTPRPRRGPRRLDHLR